VIALSIGATIYAAPAHLQVAWQLPPQPQQPTQQQTQQPRPQFASRIVIHDLAGAASRTVHEAGEVWEAPNWSRDGRHLLVNSGGRLFRIPVSGGAPEPLALDPALRCNNDHDYSPDGRLIAFSASSPSSRQSQVYVANADGSNVRLVVAAAPSYFHGWSPDGRYLSFVANRDGKQYDIYRIPADGGGEERLTTHAAHDDGSDYSPDGRWIYFNSDRGFGSDIWRIPAAGATGAADAQAERVTNDALEDWFPHPSPDGRSLLFLSFPAGTVGHNDRGLRVQLRMLPVENGEVGRGAPTVIAEIVGGQGTINVNSWAPDSRRFAYVTFTPLAAR
jgi:Tol biopolymer transport system component